MALCLGGLVLMTVLYLTKRVESNRTHRELDLVKVCMKPGEGGKNSGVHNIQFFQESGAKHTVSPGLLICV